MSAFASYLADLLLEQTLNGNGGATALDGDVFLALRVGGTEVSGFGYARVNVDSTVTDQWTVSGDAATNDNIITYAIASGGNWGTVSEVSIFDALSGGNELYRFPMIQNIAINNGDVFRFPAGAITVRHN